MQKNSDNFSIQQAMALAKHPTVQQLLSNLDPARKEQLRSAASLAAGGDYEQAKAMLSGLLSDPELQDLLSRLGR